MNVKKIGIWGGGVIGSFIVLLILIYFLFPYLNPEKAAKVKKSASSMPKTTVAMGKTTFDLSRYTMQAVDSLNQKISSQQIVIDSLIKKEREKQQLIDSLRATRENGSSKKSGASAAMYADKTIPVIKEATKPLLSLDEEALAPIVDLLDEQQLISLYKEGSGRQREKLLRTLKPEKAAKILKKVM